ncbi:MAG: methyltransferase [Bdellovibrionota bacterium]
MNIYALFLALILSSCSHFKSAQEEPPIPESLEDAVSSHSRSEENSDRDEYQHPAETLAFFGVTSKMAVVEISPGAGYFTEILAPFLAREGQYYMAVPRVPQHPPAFVIENEKKLQDILLRQTEVKAKAKFIPFEPLDKRNRTKRDFADVVLSFSSLHNWVAKDETSSSLKFCRDILKPGGTLGIVQHRIKDGQKRVPKSGYMYEKEVISLVTKAGFKYVGKSEINANPKDTADYPEGVWTLPPTYRLGEKDKWKYDRIGESDRMTLKFIKI